MDSDSGSDFEALQKKAKKAEKKAQKITFKEGSNDEFEVKPGMLKISNRSKAIKKQKVLHDNHRLFKQTQRAFTVSLAIPASIVDNA